VARGENAYQAHIGNAAARAKLAKIADDAVRIASDLRSLDLAIGEAKTLSRSDGASLSLRGDR
jgi:hypothetical protein